MNGQCLWPDPEGRQVRECARAWAEHRTERADMARRWRAVGWTYLKKLAMASLLAGIVALISVRAAEAMAWFYLTWFGSVGLWGLWAFLRDMGWLHFHTGYVAMSGHVWTCQVCGRPPAECRSEAPAGD